MRCGSWHGIPVRPSTSRSSRSGARLDGGSDRRGALTACGQVATYWSPQASEPPRRASPPRQPPMNGELTPCASALSSPPQLPSPSPDAERSGLNSGSPPAGADGNGHGPRRVGGAGGLDSTHANAGARQLVKIPAVVGKNHQLAQDTMQAAGLYNLRGGRDRSGPPADLGPELGRRPADPAGGPPRDTGHGDHAVLQEDRRVALTGRAAPLGERGSRLARDGGDIVRCVSEATIRRTSGHRPRGIYAGWPHVTMVLRRSRSVAGQGTGRRRVACGFLNRVLQVRGLLWPGQLAMR